MLRQILTVILPLIAPTALYLLWAKLGRRRTGTRDKTGSPPWLRLIAVGAALTIAVLLWVGLEGRTAAGTRYLPAHIKDGRITPGRIVATEEGQTHGDTDTR